MDIGQFIFPFIMAVITNSVMIVAIYFLRKFPYFANLFGVWFMVGLYLICILRMFLPIEFPGVQIILRDRIVYSFFVESMAERSDQAMIAPNIVLYALLGVWTVGVFASAIVSVYTQKTKTTYFLANYDFTTDEERLMFNRISTEILGEKSKVTLKKTDAVNCIMVIGYFKKYLLLPNKEYSADELEMIFRHECTHIQNKDLWLKLLVHIYCCIFWWNPFSYLLKHDLSFTLEMKCDLSAAKNMSDEAVSKYFETLTKNCHMNRDNDKNHFFICAELSDNRKNQELLKRTKALAAPSTNSVSRILVNTIVSLVFVAIFAVSYIFIWQPFYGSKVAEAEYGLMEQGEIIDENNSYLIQQEDGSYLLCIDGMQLMEVTAEEVNNGLFEGYPIYEK